MISLLAQAEGGAAYFDEGNKFNFINRNGLTDWNLRATFTDSHLFDLKQGYKPGRMRNKIKIKAMPVDISASEVVYTLLETLVISASDTETITIFFDRGPALNVLDASYTASGGSLTLDSQTNYAWGSTLVFINSHATESASITELTITADILTVKAERYLTAQDDDLIWDYGEQEYSLEDNYLLQDYDDAQQLADDELASWKDPNAELQIQTVGFPHLQIGDKLRVNSIKWATDDYFQIYAIDVEGRIAVLTTFSARKTLAIYIECVQTTWIGGSGFLAWQNTKDKFYSEENINYSIAGQFTLI